mgnify:CR=1 FL=1
MHESEGEIPIVGLLRYLMMTENFFILKNFFFCVSSRTAIRICGGGDDEEVNKDIFSLPNLLVVVVVVVFV